MARMEELLLELLNDGEHARLIFVPGPTEVSCAHLFCLHFKQHGRQCKILTA